MPRPRQLAAALRFECVAEEDRPLVVSYLAASLLAMTWLMLVHLIPERLRPILPEPSDPITIVVPPMDLPLPSVDASADASARRASPRDGSRGGTSVRDIFSGSTGLIDAGNILRGVEVAPSGATPREPTGLKVGLATGVGSRTPGRTGAEGGLSPAGAGLGTVRGGGVSRTAVSIAPPEVGAISPGGSVGNASEVGQTARARVPQLERCYHQEGLARNASLAGLVRLAITVEGGRVTSARILDRSWAGAGAAETEACLLRSVGAWRLGTSDARIVLPLSFTSAGR